MCVSINTSYPVRICIVLQCMAQFTYEWKLEGKFKRPSDRQQLCMWVHVEHWVTGRETRNGITHRHITGKARMQGGMWLVIMLVELLSCFVGRVMWNAEKVVDLCTQKPVGPLILCDISRQDEPIKLNTQDLWISPFVLFTLSISVLFYLQANIILDRVCVCVHVLQFKGIDSQRPPAECVKLKNLSELWINGISLSLFFWRQCTYTPPVLFSHNSFFFSSVLSTFPILLSIILFSFIFLFSSCRPCSPFLFSSLSAPLLLMTFPHFSLPFSLLI